ANKRLEKEVLPELAQVESDIRDLLDDVTQSKSDYQAIMQDLDTFYPPLKAAQAKADQLRAQLAAGGSDLAALGTDTPSDGYTQFIGQAGGRVTQRSEINVKVKSSADAREKFCVGFDRLSKTTKEDISLRHRDAFRRFTNFMTLHRH